MLQDGDVLPGFYFPPSLALAFFFCLWEAKVEDAKCLLPPSPAQQREMMAGPARWGQGRLAMGTGTKLGSEPERPSEIWWQGHTQQGQKPLGRNRPQSSMQEQCISLFMNDFNEPGNLMFKWFTGWTHFPDKQVDKMHVLFYRSRHQSTFRD